MFFLPADTEDFRKEADSFLNHGSHDTDNAFKTSLYDKKPHPLNRILYILKTILLSFVFFLAFLKFILPVTRTWAPLSNEHTLTTPKDTPSISTSSLPQLLESTADSLRDRNSTTTEPPIVLQEIDEFSPLVIHLNETAQVTLDHTLFPDTIKRTRCMRKFRDIQIMSGFVMKRARTPKEETLYSVGNWIFRNIWSSGGRQVLRQLDLDFVIKNPDELPMFTFVQDPISHFFAGLEFECSRNSSMPLCSESRTEQAKTWLEIVKHNASSISRPQMLFLMNQRKHLYVNMQLVAAKEEINQVMTQVIGQPWKSIEKSNEDTPSAEEVEEELESKTLTAVCKYLAMDYCFLEYEPPLACKPAVQKECENLWR